MWKTPQKCNYFRIFLKTHVSFVARFFGQIFETSVLAFKSKWKNLSSKIQKFSKCLMKSGFQLIFKPFYHIWACQKASMRYLALILLIIIHLWKHSYALNCIVPWLLKLSLCKRPLNLLVLRVKMSKMCFGSNVGSLTGIGIHLK